MSSRPAVRVVAAAVALAVTLVTLAAMAACDGGVSPPEPPAAPTAVTASPASTSALVIAWTESPDAVDRIEVERAPASGVFTGLDPVAAGVGQLRDEGLSPGSAYTYRVRACNDGGCSAFSATARATTLALLSMSTSRLPDAVRGQSYQVTLEASGGTGPYGWSATGGGLPDGLTLTSTGVIWGTPGETGSFTLTVRVTSDDGQAASRTVELAVWAPLAVEIESLPSGVRGQPYEVALEASGGNGAYQWSLAAGNLPPGLALSAGGTISGQPTSVGSGAFTVRVIGGTARSATADLVIEIHDPLRVTTEQLPDGRVGEPYRESLAASGGDGDYAWQVSGGTVPTGLSLSAGGVLSGTPAATGGFTFEVRVKSGDGQVATGEVSVNVLASGNPDAVTIETKLLPPGLVGGPYDVTLRASGGDGTSYTWVVAQGGLPPGLDLEPSGRLRGTPALAGTATPTLRVTSGGKSATATFSLPVVEHDPDRYDITAYHVAEVPAAIRSHVSEAVARWEAAVVGDLVGVVIPSGQFSPSACGGFAEAFGGTTIDDLIVLVNIASIDGQGSILGQAGPCVVRTSNTLPVAGILTLDRDDLEPLVGTQKLTDLLFHEIGHVLGFGTLWKTMSLLAGTGTQDPRFTGSGATSTYAAIGGNGSVPVENQGGSGTIESHWRESVFDREVMTGFSEAVGVTQPVSRVTIVSLGDMGYTVNADAADSFGLSVADAAAVAGSGSVDAGWDVIWDGPVLTVPVGAEVTLPGGGP